MESVAPRFECRPEISGSWVVWDQERQAIAALGGCLLKGRTAERANVACGILLRIYRNHLEARAVW